MKLNNPSHPTEILNQYFLSSPDLVVTSGKAELLASLINNQTPFDEATSITLSDIFQTSVEFWLNLQKQWDEAQRILEEGVPCPDMLEEVIMPLSAINHVLKTSAPTRTFLNEDKTKSVIVLTEQAYKYMLGKCNKSELFDLGWLGQSEKHVRSVKMSPQLRQKLSEFKNKQG